MTLKYNTKERIYKIKLTDTGNRLVVAKAGEGRKRWEPAISRCKPVSTEWMNNRVLLNHTGKCTQYPVITYDEN